VDVVAVHLLVLAPGLHVQSVLVHDLWAELCRYFVLGIVGAWGHHLAGAADLAGAVDLAASL